MNDLKDLIHDVKAIAFFIGNEKNVGGRKEEVIDLKMKDLSQKLVQLAERYEEQKANAELGKETGRKEHFNVAILSVIDKEFDALNKVFSFRKPANRKVLNNGLRVWRSTFRQKVNADKELTLLFAQIGSTGNLPSFVATDALLKEYDIDLMILCGIGAGEKKKVSIYSVVVGDIIVYYEMQKIKSDEIEYRFEPLPISRRLSTEIRDTDEDRWKATFFKLLKDNKASIKPADVANEDWLTTEWKKKLKLHKGGIFAGEKLLADDKTSETLARANQIRKDVFAFEMEGYGFAYACEENDQSNWLVFRGISDYGGPEKSKPLNKDYQKVAAYSAVAMVLDYLENICSPPVIR